MLLNNDTQIIDGAIMAASHRRFFLHHLSPIVWPIAAAHNLYLSSKLVQ